MLLILIRLLRLFSNSLLPCFVAVGLLIVSLNATAQPTVDLQQLAKQPLWLDLLHYNQGGTWRDVGTSYVDDADFFLAPSGKTNALAEMLADIAHFSRHDDRSRCRFPARYQFLARHLNWPDDKPFAACTTFLKWRQSMPDQQAVLAFPAAYLNSPSSMFGHVFLRLDASRHPDTALTSTAVNFAAQTSQTDGSLFYAFKGIVGSYPGYFSVTSYANRLNQYSHLENRDIWEYQLNLTANEIDRLVNHLWELRHVRFGYYFFDENCAYQLLGLIQVARPSVPLLTQWRFAEAPVAAVRALVANGFVEHKHYRPSREVTLKWQAARLPTEQQQLAQQLIVNPAVATSAGFQQLDHQSRFNVANLAYTALRYRNRVGERDDRTARRSFALLRLINRNSPAKPLPPVPAPTPPDTGHDDQLLATAAGQRDANAYIDVRWRYAYHGLLDNTAGFLKGADISALDLRLRTYVNHPSQRPGPGVRLEALKLVSIRSIAPRGRFVKPISWFVDSGIEQAQSWGSQHLAAYLQGGPGLAWSWKGFMPYAFVKARLENNSAYDALLETGTGSELGVLYYQGKWSARASLDGIYFHNSDWRSTAKLGGNYALGQNDALRVQWQHQRYRHQRINQWSLSWLHYF